MMHMATGGDLGSTVVFGAAEINGQGKRGWKPVPTMAFRSFLIRHGVKVLLMDEYLTSQVQSILPYPTNRLFRHCSRQGSALAMSRSPSNIGSCRCRKWESENEI